MDDPASRDLQHGASDGTASELGSASSEGQGTFRRYERPYHHYYNRRYRRKAYYRPGVPFPISVVIRIPDTPMVLLFETYLYLIIYRLESELVFHRHLGDRVTLFVHGIPFAPLARKARYHHVPGTELRRQTGDPSTPLRVFLYEFGSSPERVERYPPGCVVTLKSKRSILARKWRIHRIDLQLDRRRRHTRWTVDYWRPSSTWGEDPFRLKGKRWVRYRKRIRRISWEMPYLMDQKVCAPRYRRRRGGST